MKGEDTECFEEKRDPIELWLAQAPGRLKDQFGGSGNKVGFEYAVTVGPLGFALCWVCG